MILTCNAFGLGVCWSVSYWWNNQGQHDRTVSHFLSDLWWRWCIYRKISMETHSSCPPNKYINSWMQNTTSRKTAGLDSQVTLSKYTINPQGIGSLNESMLSFWYLLPTSSPSWEIHIVFDCSCRQGSNYPCLNDCLMIGFPCSNDVWKLSQHSRPSLESNNWQD